MQYDPNQSMFTGETVAQARIRMSNDFTPVVEQDADTLLYIGVPPREQDQSDHEYQFIKSHFSRPYFMKSATLRATGSRIFEKLLGPMSVRVQRKLKKENPQWAMVYPGSIKYYIDLRPVQSDEDALVQVTELTSPKGVLSWFEVAKDFAVHPEHINGEDGLNARLPHIRQNQASHDEQQAVNTDSLPLTDEADREQTSTAREGKITNCIDEPCRQLDRDYSRLRHHTSIERVLHAISLREPNLDSAPKVWTFCMLANLLDCAQYEKINEHIVDWLLRANNIHFVQNNPDVVYRMASVCRLTNFLRCSFAMLVGGKVIQEVARDLQGSANTNTLIRIASTQGCLDDDEINRIDHASASLRKRILEIWATLTNPDVLQSIKSKELDKITRMRTMNSDPRWQTQLSDLETRIATYLRHRLIRVPYARLPTETTNFDRTEVHYSLKQIEEYEALYVNQRLMDRRFWLYLYNVDLFINNPNDEHKDWPNFEADICQDGAVPNTSELTFLSRNSVIESIMKVNETAEKLVEEAYKPFIAREIVDIMLRTSAIKRTHRSYEDGNSLDEGNTGFWEEQNQSDFPHRDLTSQLAFRHKANDGINTTHGGLVDSFQHSPAHQPGLRQGGDMSAFADPQPIPSVERYNTKRYNHIISPSTVFRDLEESLCTYVLTNVLTPGYVRDGTCDLDIPVDDTCCLLNLGEDEWKYLPLWAGGLDDGTGGVFNDGDEIPEAPDVDMGGFRGGAMGLGFGVGSESRAGSTVVVDRDAGLESDGFEEITTDMGESTIGKASRIATEGRTERDSIMSFDE